MKIKAIKFCYGFFAVISVSAFLFTLNSIVKEKQFYENSNFNKNVITKVPRTAYLNNPTAGEVRTADNENITKEGICQTYVYPEIATEDIAYAYSEIANGYNKNCEEKTMHNVMSFYEGR